MVKQLLDTLDFITFYTLFSRTTGYQEKLGLWEKHLCFQTMEHNRTISLPYLREGPLLILNNSRSCDHAAQTEVLHLSIQPESWEEAEAYNKWVINKWQEYYTHKERKSTLKQFRFPLSTFDLQKSELNDKLSKLQQFEKSTLLNELSKQISVEIAKTAHKDLLTKVYQHFLTDHENGIYRLKYPENLTALLELRIIGKFWDRLKFLAFIDLEKTKLRIKKDLYFKLTTLTKKQVDFLFAELKSKNFISEDTCEISFGNMLRQEPVKSKILWIDLPPGNKTVINKGTLISFLDRLGVNELPDNALLYEFMCANFEVFRGQEIERKRLKSSNNVRLNTKQTTHKRYSALDKIIDDTKRLS